MKSKALSKILAANLAGCVFLTNAVFAHAYETNFWSERRVHSLSHADDVASLPLQLPKPGSVLAVTPASALYSQAALKSTKPSSASPHIPQPKPKSARSMLAAIPSAYGTVRDVSMTSEDAPIVLHIQDVHRNPEAQENIRQAIAALAQNKTVDLVAVEGGFGFIDLQKYHTFPHQDSVAASADYLLAQNEIPGAIYAALTDPAFPPVVGLEDRRLYDENVDAYRVSQRLLEKEKKQLAAWQSDLESRKAKTLNPELAMLDSHVSSYRSGKLPLGDHARQLIEPKTKLSINFESFLEALKLEYQIKFSAVEQDRNQLIQDLVKRLNQQEVASLVNDTVSYRMGAVSHATFYSHLRDVCERHGLPLQHYKAMNSYVQYVLLADSVKVDQVLAELGQLEKQRYDSLIQTPEERSLINESRQAFLVGKLLEFGLTRDEWNEYQQKYAVGKKSSDGGASTPLSSLRSFEKFYSSAIRREETMTARLKQEMAARHAKVAVLVTGGFHGTSIDHALNASDIGTVAFVPRITKVDEASATSYLSLFTQEKTPLEKLFEGSKLYLSPPVFPPATAVKNDAAIVALETEAGRTVPKNFSPLLHIRKHAGKLIVFAIVAGLFSVAHIHVLVDHGTVVDLKTVGGTFGTGLAMMIGGLRPGHSGGSIQKIDFSWKATVEKLIAIRKKLKGRFKVKPVPDDLETIEFSAGPFGDLDESKGPGVRKAASLPLPFDLKIRHDLRTQLESSTAGRAALDKMARAAGWLENPNPDAIMDDTLTVMLETPIELDGVKIYGFELEGVAARGEHGALKPDMTPHFSAHAEPTFELPDVFGRLVLHPTPPQPRVGLPGDVADDVWISDYKLWDASKRFGFIWSEFPIGYSLYKELRFEGTRAGFVIRGLTHPSKENLSTRLRGLSDTAFTDLLQVLKKHNVSTAEVLSLSTAELADLILNNQTMAEEVKVILSRYSDGIGDEAEKVGFLLRALHDAGYIHGDPKVESFSLVRENLMFGSMKNFRRKSRLPAPIGTLYQMMDVQRIWKSITSSTMNNFQVTLTQTILADEITNGTYQSPSERFWMGYFHDGLGKNRSGREELENFGWSDMMFMFMRLPIGMLTNDVVQEFRRIVGFLPGQEYPKILPEALDSIWPVSPERFHAVLKYWQSHHRKTMDVYRGPVVIDLGRKGKSGRSEQDRLTERLLRSMKDHDWSTLTTAEKMDFLGLEAKTESIDWLESLTEPGTDSMKRKFPAQLFTGGKKGPVIFYLDGAYCLLHPDHPAVPVLNHLYAKRLINSMSIVDNIPPRTNEERLGRELLVYLFSKGRSPEDARRELANHGSNYLGKSSHDSESISKDIAAFFSSHRLGEGKRGHLLTEDKAEQQLIVDAAILTLDYRFLSTGASRQYRWASQGMLPIWDGLYQWADRLTKKSPWLHWAPYLVIALAGMSEEILFRGTIQTIFGNSNTFVILYAVMFSILHPSFLVGSQTKRSDGVLSAAYKRFVLKAPRESIEWKSAWMRQWTIFLLASALGFLSQSLLSSSHGLSPLYTFAILGTIHTGYGWVTRGLGHAGIPLPMAMMGSRSKWIEQKLAASKTREEQLAVALVDGMITAETYSKNGNNPSVTATIQKMLLNDTLTMGINERVAQFDNRTSGRVDQRALREAVQAEFFKRTQQTLDENRARLMLQTAATHGHYGSFAIQTMHVFENPYKLIFLDSGMKSSLERYLVNALSVRDERRIIVASDNETAKAAEAYLSAQGIKGTVVNVESAGVFSGDRSLHTYHVVWSQLEMALSEKLGAHYFDQATSLHLVAPHDISIEIQDEMIGSTFNRHLLTTAVLFLLDEDMAVAEMSFQSVEKLTTVARRLAVQA